MKRSKRPNQYSLSKIARLNAEFPERVKLIARCGGHLRVHEQLVRRNDGTKHTIKRAICVGGYCEICHQPANGETLEPHEYKIKRSAGGHVSLDNSIMCHRSCHREQHSKPQLKWIKDNE